MSWSIGFDRDWGRDIGYGVPAWCDHPGCRKEINRGLANVCGGMPYGGDHGCGLYFCSDHLHYAGNVPHPRCSRCVKNKSAFDPKPEHPEWIQFKASDPSWEEWRQKNPQQIELMKLRADTFVDDNLSGD